MKKPIIRNWIKYWTTTIAVSGMLVVGACGDSNETVENETVTTEVAAPAQEPVADTEIEVEEEPVAQIENTAPVSDFPSTYIDNMDEHLQEFSSVNERITETLFREDLSNPINIEMEDQQVQDGNITGQDASYGQRGNNDVPQQTTTSNVEMQPDEGDINEQDTTTNGYENQSNTNLNEGPDAVIIRLEQYTADYDEEGQQRINEIVGEYNTRRENLRGQIDPETGVYASPEIDPQPNVGVDQLMTQIQENLEYPQNAAAAEIEGTIFVNFVVDENGNVTQAEANPDLFVPTTSMQYIQPLNPTKFSEQEIEEAKIEMMEAAVKVVEATSGNWIPAQQNGQIVRAEVQLPVVFDLEVIGAPEDVPLQE